MATAEFSSINASPSNGKYAVELKNTHIYYGAFRAVNNVNLQIERQRITAFIGPSGCGKSTVLRAINPLHQAMLHAGTAFDIATMPTLYYRSTQTAPLQCVASDPWSTLVGSWALGQPAPSPLVRAFVAGRHIAYYRPEHYARVLYPTDEAMQRFIDGLQTIARGGADFGDDPALRAINERFRRGEKAHDEFVSLVGASRYIDPRAYARASDCSVVRAGMLLCADLFSVRDSLSVAPGVAVLQNVTDLVEDVASFAVSDGFTQLRRELVGRR